MSYWFIVDVTGMNGGIEMCSGIYIRTVYNTHAHTTKKGTIYFILIFYVLR